MAYVTVNGNTILQNPNATPKAPAAVTPTPAPAPAAKTSTSANPPAYTGGVYVSDPAYTGAGANKVYNIGGTRVQAPTESAAVAYLFNNNLPIPDEQRAYYGYTGKTPTAPTTPAAQVPRESIDGGAAMASRGGVPSQPLASAQLNTSAAAPSQTNVAPSAQAPTSALQPGNTGAGVKALQDYLVASGLMQQSDLVGGGYGTYGPKTTAAVAALQQSLGVDNSSGVGYFGPKTIAALNAYNAGTNSGQNTNPSGITTNSGTGTGMGTGTPTASPTTTGDPTDKYSGMDPVSRQIAMYEDTYNSLGLADIKSQYEKVLQDQKDLQNEKQDKVDAINNNPWLSDGVRINRITKIDESYQSREATLTNLETLYDSLYKQGTAQVETIVSSANADIKLTNELAQKKLDAAASLAKDNTVQSVGGRELLISKITGQVIADLGPTTHFSSGSSSGVDGMTSRQLTAFNQIVSAYNRSPLIMASDRTAVLKNTIQQVYADPNNAAIQLNLAYSYIQALDTYQSAVREGELSLVNSIDSKVGQLQNSISQIQNGQIIRPEVAKQIADAALLIVNTIDGAAKQKAESFRSQANVVGVGTQWDEYEGGFTAGFDSPPITPADTFTDINSVTFPAVGQALISRKEWSSLGARQDALLAYMKAQGYELKVSD